MPPRVEGLRPIEQLEGISCFVVDLSRKEDNKEDNFDASLFDDQLRKVSGLRSSGDVKFIVVNDKLLVFPHSKDHTTIYALTKPFFQNEESGGKEQLQCAGTIMFNFTEDEANGPRRKIYGFSIPLLDAGLSVGDSNRYKDTVLRTLLGKHFTIE